MIEIGNDGLPTPQWMSEGAWRYKNGEKQEKLIISLSSGADSALLLWIVAKSFSDYPSHENHEIKCWHAADLSLVTYSSVERCEKIIQAVRNDFPNVNITLTTFDYKKEKGVDLKTHYIKPARTEFSNKNHNAAMVIGSTMQYDDDILRNNGMEKQVDGRDGNPIGKPQYIPFYNITKVTVARWYKEYGLMDTLFPYTVSCTAGSLTEVKEEGREVYYKRQAVPCKECWWCKEKYYAFGKYDEMRGL